MSYRISHDLQGTVSLYVIRIRLVQSYIMYHHHGFRGPVYLCGAGTPLIKQKEALKSEWATSSGKGHLNPKPLG